MGVPIFGTLFFIPKGALTHHFSILEKQWYRLRRTASLQEARSIRYHSLTVQPNAIIIDCRIDYLNAK
jgi:hypothetical protein